MKNTNQLYQEITDKFIACLKEGKIPWKKGYTMENAHDQHLYPIFYQINGSTGKAYRSVNSILLQIAQEERQFERPLWLTFRQAKALDIKVKKGAKSTAIYYRDCVYYQLTDQQRVRITKESYEKLKQQDPKQVRVIPYLRRYRLFNFDQIEGDLENLILPKKAGYQELDNKKHLLEGYAQMPPLAHGEPGYSPVTDMIYMPDKEEFVDHHHYHQTLFHEVIHSTGHTDRLCRDTLTSLAAFRSSDYAKEELIAEIGASFLSGQFGIFNYVEQQSKAYFQDWITVLEDDPQMILRAAAQAQKAVDYINQHTPVATTVTS